MFSIGELSRLAKVTVEALRHYDVLGMLKPAKVSLLLCQTINVTQPHPRAKRDWLFAGGDRAHSPGPANQRSITQDALAQLASELLAVLGASGGEAVTEDYIDIMSET